MKRWTNDSGELHRENGPAIEFDDGDTEWYINGNIHRNDGPAIDGKKFRAGILMESYTGRMDLL